MSATYDPDEVVPRNSPLLQSPRPVFPREPSPPPSFLGPDVGSAPPLRGNGVQVQASQADAVLVGLLDGGRKPDIVQLAGNQNQTLPSDSDGDGDDDMPSSSSCSHSLATAAAALAERAPFTNQEPPPETEHVTLPVEPGGGDPGRPTKIGGILQSLAAGALAFATTDAPATAALHAGPAPPCTEHHVVKERPPAPLRPPTFREVPCPDAAQVHPVTAPSPYTPSSLCSPNQVFAPPSLSPANARSPPGVHGEGLPPIMHSPSSESNGNTPLPSIRAQLGDLGYLEHTHAADPWPKNPRHSAFSAQSPPTNMSRMGSISQLSQGSPPREPPSPAFPGAPLGMQSPPFHYHRNAFQPPPPEVAGPAATPQSDLLVPPPAPPAADRGGHPLGSYVCTYPGCNAQPFQTQYLLNSHTNVHSSIRPHYCPVKGCPRSEGGRGFKRKNEMIRHGLIHDSPGYVCPFCSDREHKYPRPDNLQRHVRVHHTDKDKDDPLLREILAQRSDGPSRSRRRRNAQSA